MKFVRALTIAATVSVAPMLALAQADDSILVDEYIVSQEFIEATVVRVRPHARTITVRGEKRGQTRQFTVPEGTRISVNGRDARLRDIRVGDSVLLAMTPTSDKVVISRLRVPNTPQTLEQRRANPIVQDLPAQLPKTASPWPSTLAVGLLALLAAGFLRLRRSVL